LALTLWLLRVASDDDPEESDAGRKHRHPGIGKLGYPPELPEMTIAQPPRKLSTSAATIAQKLAALIGARQRR
jgi:hypothetical protein